MGFRHRDGGCGRLGRRSAFESNLAIIHGRIQLSGFVLRPQPRVQDINGAMPPSSTAHSWKRLDNSCESMKAEDSIQATELNADHGNGLSRPRCWLRWFHEHAPASRRAGEVIASASRSCSLEKGEERARFRAAATGRSGVLKSSR